MASCSSHPVMELEVEESIPRPNWLKLPTDITMNILQRLGTLEILKNARNVCPYWWNICKDPLMWHTIDMADISLPLRKDVYYYRRLEMICNYVIELSCGYLKYIYIKNFGTDDLLSQINISYINELRCMRFEGCHEMTDEEFMEVVKKQPLLEELEVFHCVDISDSFECIGKSCPLLKSLKYCPCSAKRVKSDDSAIAIAKTMPGLCHLTLLRNELTNEGLLAILDGCPLLESLDLRGCIHLDLRGSLGKRCKEQIKKLRLPSERIDPRFNICDIEAVKAKEIAQFFKFVNSLKDLPLD